MSTALAELRKFDPQVIVFWPQGISLSQYRIWEPYIRNSRHRIAVIAKTHEGKPRPNAPNVFFEDEDEISLEQINALSSFRTALYPTIRTRTATLVKAFPSKFHVFIGHGDSDKDSSSRSTAGQFDYIFVADEDARLRYRSQRFPRRMFHEIGAPFYDGIEQGKTGKTPSRVVYAPTWEGYGDSNNYTSLPAVAHTLKNGAEAFADLTVSFMCHPGAGGRLPEVKSSISVVKKSFSAVRNSSKVAVFNKSDAMLTDVSGVMTEYLATRKPIVVTDIGTDAFTTALARSKFSDYVALWSPEKETLAEAIDRAMSDPIKSAREAAADRKFGARSHLEMRGNDSTSRLTTWRTGVDGRQPLRSICAAESSSSSTSELADSCVASPAGCVERSLPRAKRTAVQFVLCRLSDRSDDDSVHVDVPRQFECVHDDLGHVVRSQRVFDPLIQRVDSCLVATETTQSEFLGFDLPGRDVDDANRLASQFQPQHVHQRLCAVLRHVVPAAGFIRHERGR